MQSESRNRDRSTSQNDRGVPGDRQGRILLVLSAAAFMASLDLFIVNVAFDSIGRDFDGASLSDLSWILNGYAIAYAALLVPLGRLADRYGRKEGFLGGLALFALASAACALSPGLWWLVVFRVLQAAGAAALTPTSLSLLLRATEPARRARAVRIWAATGALAAAIGPVVGGLLVQAAWQWVFVVNVPIAIVAIVSAIRWVPDSRDATVERTPDLLGAGVLAIAIGALALSVVKGPDWGWSDTRDVAGFVVAALGIALFAYRTARHPVPVVEPAMLAVRTFAWSNVATLVFSVAFGAGLLSTILWFQQVWDYGPVRSGLAIAPGPAMVQVTALISNRLARRGVPAGLVAALGCVMLAAGYLYIAFSVGVHPHWATRMLPGQLLVGGGVGFALPTILSSGTSALPPQRTATGSAVITMNRQIGTVLGVSILIAILGSPVGLTQAHHVFRLAWLTIAGIGVAGAVVSVGITPSRRAATSAAVPAAGDAA